MATHSLYSIMYSIIIAFIAINRCDTESYTYVSADSECDPCDGSEISPYSTIQQGLDNSGSNILKILSGTYTGSGNVNLVLTQSWKVITTQHPHDSSQTIIDCQNNAWGIYMKSGAYSIIGLTIKNCIATTRDNVINKNHRNQTLGGALFIESVGSAKNIGNCTFENNEADIGGAMYINSASVILQNVVIQNNNAHNYSGGVYLQSAYLRSIVFSMSF